MKLNGPFQETPLATWNWGSCIKNLYDFFISSYQYSKGLYLLSNEYMIQMFVKCPEAASGKPNNKFSCRDLWLHFLKVWGCGFGWNHPLNTVSWNQSVLWGRARAVPGGCGQPEPGVTAGADLLPSCRQLIRDLLLNSVISARLSPKSRCSNWIPNFWSSSTLSEYQ